LSRDGQNAQQSITTNEHQKERLNSERKQNQMSFSNSDTSEGPLAAKAKAAANNEKKIRNSP